MNQRLVVWLNSDVVGTLETDKAGVVRYVPSSSQLLSAASAGSGTWSPELTLNWFEGLLPEGDRRRRLAGRFGVLENDTFGLLAEVGWECAGAVSILPEGHTPHDGSHEIVPDSVVGDHLDALPSLAGTEDSEIRVSLGGQQDKLLLARFDDKWAIPKDGAPSTHILKPEIARYPGSADAEGWALAVSAAVTATSEAYVSRDLAARPVLVVTRYDRLVDAQGIARLHQEDLCQALGLPPSSKYDEGGNRAHPTFRELAQILLERADDPPAELERLLQQLTLSIAIRNADLHGKNLSIVYAPTGLASLAPAYDVMTTTAFLPAQQHAGLTVAGKYKLSEIGTDHLVAEAKSWGIPERRAGDEIARVLSLIPDAVTAATDRFPEAPHKVRSETATGLFLTSIPAPGRRRRSANRP